MALVTNPPSVTSSVAGRVLCMSGVRSPKLMSLPNSRPTLKQPLMKPASRAMASPLGKLKSFTASRFSSSESDEALHRACNAYDGDAEQRHHHAEDDGEGERAERVELGEEDVEQHRAHDCPEAGARAERYALPQGHAQVAHGKAKGEPANAPEHAEEDGHPDVERSLGREQFSKAMACRDGQQGTQQGQHEPGEHALHYPVRLPAPVLYLVYRHVAARLAERSHGYYEQSYDYVHCFMYIKKPLSGSPWWGEGLPAYKQEGAAAYPHGGGWRGACLSLVCVMHALRLRRPHTSLRRR